MHNWCHFKMAIAAFNTVYKTATATAMATATATTTVHKSIHFNTEKKKQLRQSNSSYSLCSCNLISSTAFNCTRTHTRKHTFLDIVHLKSWSIAILQTQCENVSSVRINLSQQWNGLHTHFIETHIHMHKLCVVSYAHGLKWCINQFSRTWVSWHSFTRTGTQGPIIYVQQRFPITSPSQANKDERFNFSLLLLLLFVPFFLSLFFSSFARLQLNSGITGNNQVNSPVHVYSLSMFVCMCVRVYVCSNNIYLFITKQTRCNQKWNF